MEKLLNFLNKKYIFWIFLILGILMLFYPMILNPNLLPGDLGDTRFLNYILEHGYLFLTGMPNHSHFWDMPFYYPYDNTLAYSDMLIGGMIIYVPIRFLIHSPLDAFQIFCVIVSGLNYLSFYLLERKVFNFSRLLSSFGAFLFAFNLLRHVQINHFQLHVQFYSIFALLFFLLIKKENSKLKNHSFILFSAIFFSLQLYTSFYLGWYLIYGISIFLLISLVFKNLRKNIYNKFNLYNFFFFFVLSTIFLIPLIIHYHAVGNNFEFEMGRIFNLRAFIFTISFLDDFICNKNFSPYFSTEYCFSIGYLLTILSIVGFSLNKNKIYIFFFLVISMLFLSQANMNEFLYNYFPGAKAIRAGLRYMNLLLPIVIIGAIFFLDKIKNKILLIISILVLFFEQIPYIHYYTWTKKEHNYRIEQYRFPYDCQVVQYDYFPYAQYSKDGINSSVDEMWLTTKYNIRLVNGYSGYNHNIQKQYASFSCSMFIPNTIINLVNKKY